MNINQYNDIHNELSRLIDKNFFFVVGLPKSGTTWLQILLDHHPKMVCKGEAYLAANLAPSIQKTVVEYNERLKFGKKRFIPFIYDKNDQDYLFLTSILLLLHKWIDGDMSVTHIGERTPGDLPAMLSWHRYFPDARYIHIIRDPRDGATSGYIFNQSINKEKFLKDFPNFSDYAKAYAENWVNQIGMARECGERIGSLYREVRYEDLLSNTNETVKSIFSFLGVDHDDAIVNRCVEESSFESLSGGRKKGVEDKDSHFRKGVSGDWKNHFTEELELAFQRVSGDMMSDLGYK